MTTCVDCGHSISEHARACPKCKWRCEKCILCGEPIKKAEFYQNSYSCSETFHRDCLSAHFQIPSSVACPDCGTSLAETSLETSLSEALSKLKYADFSCPECGFPNPLQRVARCHSCGLDIFASFQTELKGRYPSGDCYPGSFHSFCLTKLNQLYPNTYFPVQS